MAPHLLAAALAALARRVSLDAAGFTAAAERASSLPLKRLLQTRADGCRDDLRALGEAVDTLPAGSLAAAQAMLRVANDEPAWPEAGAPAGDASMVEACEQAEAATAADYDRLLAMALPRAVREPLARAAARSRASLRVLSRLAALERVHAA